MVAGGGEIRDGLLTVRMGGDGDRCVVSLEGEVDLANFEVMESTLRKAMGNGAGEIVVDMRNLSFIDSTGIACLVRALRDDGEAGRLRFVHSDAPAVARVLRLTGVDEKLTPAASA